MRECVYVYVCMCAYVCGYVCVCVCVRERECVYVYVCVSDEVRKCFMCISVKVFSQTENITRTRTGQHSLHVQPSPVLTLTFCNKK